MKNTKTILQNVLLIGVLSLLAGCCSVVPWPWCLEDFAFTPASITRLAPTHIGGDREFKGHGPDVVGRASLEIRNETEIWVVAYLHAKETQSDWTEAEGEWERKLWTAPVGKKIVKIASDKSSETNYRDTDHELDRPSVRGGDLVKTFEIMGDTGGDDVGNNTADDVYMNLYFNEIRGKMKSAEE